MRVVKGTLNATREEEARAAVRPEERFLLILLSSIVVVVVVDLADLNGSANRGLAQLRTAAETVE